MIVNRIQTSSFIASSALIRSPAVSAISQVGLRFLHASPRVLAYPADKKGRPLKSFQRFSKENYHEIAKSDPSLKFQEIGRKMGELWRGLSTSEKAKYDSEYKTAFEAWKNNQPF